MRVLYLLADALYVVLYHIVSYRKKVVYYNLKLSFPEASENVITEIQKDFYSHLADLIVESVKSFSISKKEILGRIDFPTDFVFKDFGEQRSVLLLLGHCGNWEWAGLGSSAITPFKMHIVYHQLSNQKFDALMHATRSRFGAELSRMEETLRSMVRLKNIPTATCLVADQNPTPETAYWIDFLHRKTAFFKGPFKLAQKFDLPCYYVSNVKVSRGHYQLKPILISSKTHKMTEQELAKVYVELLEKDIKENPAHWLWSHRRWKHKYTPSLYESNVL